MAYRLLHKKSSVSGKTPSSDQLEFGEIAINYNSNSPTIYIKNSEKNIVSFIDEENIKTLITNENKDIKEKIDVFFNDNPEINETIDTLKEIQTYFDTQGKDVTDLIETVNELKNNTQFINVTYEELISLCNNSQLTAHAKYCITDYVTTTIQDDTISALHPFDIVVEAISTNTLSEDAKAFQSSRDNGYFNNNKLESWEIKYCIYNDTTRFAWVDETNGKGVIYYMKDEYNNEAWYDFKNIQFLRTTDFFDTNSFLPYLEGNNYYFTFSNIVNNEIIDGTIYNENITISIQNKIDKINDTKYSLNNTIFINDSSSYTRYNVIGFGNHTNTFGAKCQANTILQHCYNNVVSNMFRNNVIAQYFCNNKVSGQFEYNTLGIQCWNNDFSGHIWFTTFGSQFNYCSFNIPEGSELEYCEFGSGIGFLNGIPPIKKVTFENNVAWYNSTTYVSNLQTIDGITLEEALTQKHDEQLYVYKVGDKYGVTSLHNINNNTLTPIYSNPNLDFDSTNNNVNCHGYVGTLQNINVNGDLILIDSIGVYVREGNASPNLDTPVWCRLLKFVNGAWEIVYQSIESKTIMGIAPETLFSFKMKAVNEQNKLIKSTDKIAIVYVDAENALVISSVLLGYKSINVPGGLSNQIANNSTGVSNWAPAFVIGYLSMADTPKNVVTIENSQTITGTKQFNNGINISGKSFISSSIESGELKVLHNDSNKGFIIRTNNTSDDILPLEILSTNGENYFQYIFPKTNGNIPVGVKINDTIYNAEVIDGLIDLTNIFNELATKINENEVVTAKALNDLNSRLQKLEIK